VKGGGIWEKPHHIQPEILAVICIIQKEPVNDVFPFPSLVTFLVEQIKRENLYLELTLGFIQICLGY